MNQASAHGVWHVARLEFFTLKVTGLEVEGCNLLPELRERAAAARKPNYTELRVTELEPCRRKWNNYIFRKRVSIIQIISIPCASERRSRVSLVPKHWYRENRSGAAERQNDRATAGTKVDMQKILFSLYVILTLRNIIFLGNLLSWEIWAHVRSLKYYFCSRKFNLV